MKNRSRVSVRRALPKEADFSPQKKFRLRKSLDMSLFSLYCHELRLILNLRCIWTIPNLYIFGLFFTHYSFVAGDNYGLDCNF